MRVVAVSLLLIAVSCSRGTSSGTHHEISDGVRSFVALARASRPGELETAFNRAAEALELRRTGLSAAGTTDGYSVEMHLRRSTMPDGPREWITISFRGDPRPIDAALAASAGPVTGRGFGDEDGWLFPNGGLILERWQDRRDITFSPGPPEDALEDLARPHLPSLAEAERRLKADGWWAMAPEPSREDFARKRLRHRGGPPEVVLLYIPSASRLVGLTIDSGDETAIRGVLTTLGVGDVPLGRCLRHANYFIIAEPDRITLWRRPFAMWNLEIQERCA